MTLSNIDLAIILIYLVLVVGKSFYFSRRAAKGSEHYFLAGKNMPWWALGASGMSSNLDVAGTVTIVTLVYLYGLHGFFIEMRGGVVLPIAVFLAFMGKWHQRSNVVTTGEWMGMRFGNGLQGKAARFTAAITYVIITIGMIVFFLVATGYFLSGFLPFDEITCRFLMAGIMLTYTLISGLYGVIWTDVLQAGLMGVVAIYLTVLASGFVDPELMASWPGAKYNTIIPIFAGGLYTPSQPIYAPFFLFFVFWIGKGVLEGLGGSGGSAYMAQRFYAAQDETTVKKLCMLWTVLFAFRWPMVLAFVVLAIECNLDPQNSSDILLKVLGSGHIPSGMLGIVLVALLAASMSTFDSTVNAGASYVVRDFVRVLKKNTTEKEQVYAGYFSSAGLVAAGVAFSLLIPTGDTTKENLVLFIWRTIVVQLFPAFLLPFALRWFWARFNGAGFTVGIAFGFVASLILSVLPPFECLKYLSPWVENGELTDVTFLICVGLASFLGCLAGTFASQPTPKIVLRTFYQQIRPIGVWPRNWKRDNHLEHRYDLMRLSVALVWQVSTFLWPMTAFLGMWPQTLIIGMIWVVTGTWLIRDIKKPRTR